MAQGALKTFVQTKSEIVRFSDKSIDYNTTRSNAFDVLEKELLLLASNESSRVKKDSECPEWAREGFLATCQAYPALAMSIEKALIFWKGKELDLMSFDLAKKTLPSWIRENSGSKEEDSLFYPDYRGKVGKIGAVFLRNV